MSSNRFFSGNNNMPGGWNIKDESDLRDVSLPPNASQSREVADAGGPNDAAAQHVGAASLAYSLHGAKCAQCGAAESESALCPIGRTIYAELLAARSRAGIM